MTIFDAGLGDDKVRHAGINLHIDRKKTLPLLALFSLLFVFVNVLIAMSTDDHLVEFNALSHSSYELSAITHKSVEKDDYYQFNAGISFAVSAESKTRLNADVVMRSNNSEYTNSVYWNAGPLNADEVAISKGLAKRYGLSAEDKLYSKHGVDGKIHEYTVNQILPDAIRVRNSKENNYNNGIIVMGYDKQYVDNLSHSWIVFTDRSFEDLASDKAVMPESIIYRDDEIFGAARDILPYLLLWILLSIIAIVLLNVFISKSISYIFRRLALLGYKKHELNYAFRKVTCGSGFVVIVMASLLSALIFYVLSLCSIGYVLLCCTSLVAAIALWIVSGVKLRQLWRR